MSNRNTYIIAAILLFLMFVLAITSMAGDSLTMDEMSHLPAGYSYLTQKDMRINPEHPPLVKDLAALPLLFIKGIKFPSDIKAWKEDINSQWDFGNYFLYKMGNPADKMIFWGRLPMILILILLGFYVFKWTRELFGNKAGLLALFLYSFSPTFLAHGRLVTTDVAAAAGAFIATYYFIKSLKAPWLKNIILSGVAFGIAELLKFSLILLVPFFVILTVVFWLSKGIKTKQALNVLILTFAIGAVLIWPVYQYHTWNYPAEKQVKDTKFILNSYGSRAIANTIAWMADKPGLRPYAQYLLGVAMVTQRASGGNTSYFKGEVSSAGWKNYFPTVYLLKEPLAFHVLNLIAFVFGLWLIVRAISKNALRQLKKWLKTHIDVVAMLLFGAIYWLTSLSSNLNIGVRHLLPTLPFAFAILAGVVALWLKPPFLNAKKFVFALLVAWQALSVFSVYPHFISYFNELGGGPENGYQIAVDSNYDWGQDMKRLASWAEKNLPAGRQVYVDYFGGSDAQYYLKEKFAPWQGNKKPDEFPKGNYLAVSATFLQNGRAKPAPGFDQPTDFYRWLDNYKPVARIGYSIFVYRIDPAPILPK